MVSGKRRDAITFVKMVLDISAFMENIEKNGFIIDASVRYNIVLSCSEGLLAVA